MATFLELKNSLIARVRKAANDDVIAAIPSEINRVIDFYSKKRFWFNTAYTSATVSSAATTITLPSNYLVEVEPSGFVLEDTNYSRVLVKVDPAIFDLDKQGIVSGRPNKYCLKADNLVYISPVPNKTYTIKISYLKTYAALVNDADNNDFTNNAEYLIKIKALSNLYNEFRIDNDLAVLFNQNADLEFKNLMEFTNKKIGTSYIVSPEDYNNRTIYY